MAQQNGRAPFSSFTSTQSQMAYSGPMSYNPGIHGSTSSFLAATPFPALTDPSTLPPDPTFHDISVATHKQIASLQAKLDQKLGPEFVSQRPGPGGGPKLTYAEGWKIINLANEVFGFNGWSSSISSLNIDYLDPHDEGRRWNCNVTAVVRVTLRDGVYHEDVGCGSIENSKSKSMALDKCKKEAVTDALKRTLRNFGNLLGNCLYDKQYTQEIVKIKVQPPKFDRGALYRRPEFEEGKSENGGKVGPNEGMATSTSKPSKMPPPPLPQQSGKANLPARVKSEPGASSAHPIAQQQSNPQRAVPAPVPRSGNSSISSHSSASAKILPVLPPAHGPCVDPDEASYFHSDDDALLAQLADMDGVGSMVLEEDRPLEYEDENVEDISGMGANQVEPGPSRGIPARHPNSGPSPPSSVPNTDTNDAHGQPTPQNHYRLQPKAQSHAGQQNLQQRPPQPQHRAVNQRPPQPQPRLQITQQQPQHQHPHNPHQQRPQHTPQQQHPQQRPQQQQRLQNQYNYNQQIPQNQPNQTLQHPQNQPIHNQQPRPPPQQAKPVQAQSTTAPSHPATPSTGGFHFPPGMDTFRPTARLSGPPSSDGPGSAQVSGTKRSAEAMSSAASNGNKAHAMSDAGTKARAPFAPLEISDGGDVKRIRR